MVGWLTRSDRAEIERELDAVRTAFGDMEARLAAEASARAELERRLLDEVDGSLGRVTDDVSRLRGEVAERDGEARLQRGLDDVVERVTALEARHAALAGQVKQALRRLEGESEPGSAEGGVVATLRLGLVRLERKVEAASEQARGETLALLDRIDTLRGRPAA